MSRCINGTLISTATNDRGKVSAETLKTAHSQQESGTNFSAWMMAPQVLSSTKHFHEWLIQTETIHD
jgi:hypothetical protein